MKLPARPIAALCLCTGLLLAGCSSDSGDTSSSDASASAEVSGADTGGSCDVTVSEESASASPTEDEDASQEALDSVTLSDDAAAAPTVSFDAPLAITSEVATVADEGSGETITDGQLITFNYLVCDTVTGEKMHSTWGTTAEDDAPETYVLSVDNFGETLTEAFASAKPGARLLWAQPGLSAEESSTGEAVNGYLYVMSVTAAQTLPDAASGTEVTPTDEALPVVTMEDGKPSISIPSSFTDPTDLVVQPLIDGEGATVETGQTVAVKYSGWLTDGTQFDSSWEREAPNDVLLFQVGAGGVIEGWDQGIVGQKVGSRLLLVIPSDLAYGEDGYGDSIPADAPLIFVVDILAAF